MTLFLTTGSSDDASSLASTAMCALASSSFCRASLPSVRNAWLRTWGGKRGEEEDMMVWTPVTMWGRRSPGRIYRRGGKREKREEKGRENDGKWYKCDTKVMESDTEKSENGTTMTLKITTSTIIIIPIPIHNTQYQYTIHKQTPS